MRLNTPANQILQDHAMHAALDDVRARGRMRRLMLAESIRISYQVGVLEGAGAKATVDAAFARLIDVCCRATRPNLYTESQP